MKTNKFKLLVTLLVLCAMTFFVSCDDDNNNNNASGGAPSVATVSLAQNDSLVEFGFANTMYIIKGHNFIGTQKIYFNDVDTYFNPVFVTDDVILVTIDERTPYENVPDELKIVTKSGTAIYTFKVLPPAPTVTSFNPINAPAGEQFTIYGKFFLDPTVTVGGVEAEIVSSTLEEIVAVMPANANRKFVKVETLSGESEWNTAVGTAIYDDVFYAPFTIEAWNNHQYITDVTKAYQGTTFIKKTIAGYDNIQGNWGWDESATQYTGIHVSIRSDDPGKLILIFNGAFWGDATKAFTTDTQWKEYRFTWAQLGGMPQAVQNISFQEFSGGEHNYYFDNIGYTTD